MVKWAQRQERFPISILGWIWMLLYPFLVYQGIGTVVIMAYLMYAMITNPSLLHGVGGLYVDAADSILNIIYDNYLWLSLIICAFTIPLLYLFMHMDREKEVKYSFRMDHWAPSGPGAYILSAVLGISSCVVLNHLLVFSGLYELLEEGYSPTAQILYNSNFWLEVLAVGILSPLVEELVFRGLIYRRLRWRMEAFPAIFLSALFFAVFHTNLLQGIYALLMGMMMGWVYERHHNLLAPAAFHIGANVTSVILSDSGLLDWVYESDAGFLGATAFMMLVFVVAAYLALTTGKPQSVEPVPVATEIKEEEYGT